MTADTTPAYAAATSLTMPIRQQQEECTNALDAAGARVVELEPYYLRATNSVATVRCTRDKRGDVSIAIKIRPLPAGAVAPLATTSPR